MHVGLGRFPARARQLARGLIAAADAIDEWRTGLVPCNQSGRRNRPAPTACSAFKRIAVVCDRAWVADTLHALAWLVPGDLALFGLDELERAKDWAAS